MLKPLKTNKQAQQIVLVTKETAGSILAWILKNPQTALLLASLGWGIYLNEIVIPGKDKALEEALNRTPKIETIVRVDTLIKEKVIRVPRVDTIYVGKSGKKYGEQPFGAPFSDTLITGEIYGKALYDTVKSSINIYDVGLNYSFIKPITCTDSIITVTTPGKTEYLPTPRNFRVQAGLFAGGGSAAFGLGPELGILTKRDDSYTYRYNLIDKTHWVSFKKTIRLRGK